MARVPYSQRRTVAFWQIVNASYGFHEIEQLRLLAQALDRKGGRD